jgi:mannitol/fructose-specific phosphotransferase system IIA component
MDYILSAIIAWLVLCIVLQNREHRKTIDKLTDKLMAKDYKEYKLYAEPKKEEKPVRLERLSFFDDEHEVEQ